MWALPRIDKYTPEACIIIGNYYSLKGEHEKAAPYLRSPSESVPNTGGLGQGFSNLRSVKAVIYFRRALALNRHFTPAWILTLRSKRIGISAQESGQHMLFWRGFNSFRMGHEFMEMKNTAAAPWSFQLTRLCIPLQSRCSMLGTRGAADFQFPLLSLYPLRS